jgi:thioredoxin-dependent peroxiredoxin
MLTIGQEAPGFEAEGTKGTVDLSSHLGKQPIVLIFYPKDETPICTKQLCAVRDSKAQYAKYDALVLGINPGDLESHISFAQKNGYDFPLLTDTDKTINRLYDVGDMLFGLIGQHRVVYVIGSSGRILYARRGNRPTEEILAVLEQDTHSRPLIREEKLK